MDNNIIVDDPLFCKNIIGIAKAQNLFEMVDKLISENSLDLEKCFGMCSDRARSMSDCYEGLVQISAYLHQNTACYMGLFNHSQGRTCIKADELSIEFGIRTCCRRSKLYKNLGSES